MIEQFVHILLFDCPQCKCPLASTLLSEFNSLEQIDAREMKLRCNNCRWIGKDHGLGARRHLVLDWEQRNNTAAFNVGSTEKSLTL